MFAPKNPINGVNDNDATNILGSTFVLQKTHRSVTIFQPFVYLGQNRQIKADMLVCSRARLCLHQLAEFLRMVLFRMLFSEGVVPK